jgi:hypothetical protein
VVSCGILITGMGYVLDLPDGFAQASLKFKGTALRYPGACVIGLNVDEAGSTPENTAAVIAGAWATSFEDVQSSGVTLESILVKFGPIETGPSAEVVYNDVGGSASSSSSPQVSCLIRKNSLMGGKRGKGRMYIPGIPEGVVDPDGTIISATLSLWQTAANAFYSSLATGLRPMYLLHRTREPGTTKPTDPGSPAPIPSLVTSLSAQSVVATQRRRLRR